MLNVYILKRQDESDYGECIKQAVVAITEERAIKLASKENGTWYVSKKVDLNIEQILTKYFNDI